MLVSYGKHVVGNLFVTTNEEKEPSDMKPLRRQIKLQLTVYQ